jgi:hypothetical protein
VHLGTTPRLVALAIVGLWYQDRMGGWLEEPSKPKEEMTRNEWHAGKSWRQKKELKFLLNM